MKDLYFCKCRLYIHVLYTVLCVHGLLYASFCTLICTVFVGFITDFDRRNLLRISDRRNKSIVHYKSFDTKRIYQN